MSALFFVTEREVSTRVEISKDFDIFFGVNPLSANPTKWPNTLKQFVGKLPTNCLSVFGHFVNLALKRSKISKFYTLRNFPVHANFSVHAKC